MPHLETNDRKVMFEQNIVKLINHNSKAVILEFSENDKEKAWLQVKHPEKYSNHASHWNAFLNLLSQNILSEWLKEELDLSQPITLSSPDIWELVNGTSFSIGDKRIMIIPSEAIDNQEFCVPQEWVDIPKFVADYYLAVQIIPDELSLCIWGFTTHLDLKNQGQYDAFEHTYTLLRDDLVQEINAFLVSLKVCPQQREAIPTLPKISANEAENLIKQLSQASAYSPRLDIDFLKWAALLENDEWRQKLYEHRNSGLVSAITPSVVTPTKAAINLSSWLENIFDTNWQTLEELFATSQVNWAFRNERLSKKPDAKTLKQIRNLIEQIKNTSDEGQRQIAAERLGEIGYQDKETIDSLIHLIRTTQNEETRWIAAASLWMIDPDNSTVGVKRGSNLGMQLAGNALALIVGFLEKSDGKVAVLVQVHAMEGQRYLPRGCRMTVLDETGNIFSEIVARESDRAIQKKFSAKRGERFSVKISLGDSCIAKDFSL
ncbi:DUF1822 family protein [Nostoc sphaeroides CHAB 2801]|uniref:DUF1822 family protein n=1 Tax=Nostoc sphaeroides TaxID=446679 RepID=UPI001E53D8F1|nr:DUF1822 family protein [Nostoc sphaeroides]MCC5633067.1 DUF1822 family protein [Nostoc sphaeroides CHAB 2801]